MKRIRIKAYCLLLIMLCNVLAPIPGWALSGGNKAPEFESFQPFGLDNMVDPATGDFSYNIPLMNVGFHGINLFYQAGITMDQEATMVGLGWNINSGMIDRNVRGIPDDFNGDEVVKEKNMKSNITFGFGPGVSAELYGADAESVANFDLKFGVSYNTYNGIGFEYSLGPSFDIKLKNSNKLTAGIGITGSTDEGISLEPKLSYKSKFDEKEKKHNSIVSLGGSINSKSGLSSIKLGSNQRLKEKGLIQSGELSQKYSFSKPSYIQDVEFPMTTKSYTLKATVGGELFGLHGGVKANGYYNKQSLATKIMAIKAYGMMYHEECPDDGLQDFHRNGDIPQSEKVPNLAVPTLDFDVYSVSGPGLSGTLQLNRGDLGLVYDRAGTNTSVPINLGVEAGAGNLVHLGLDLGTNILKDEVKKWTSDNDFNLPFSFKSIENNQHKFEKAILNKVDDEVIEIPNSNDFFSMIKNTELIRPNVKHMGAINSKVDGTVKSDADQTNNYNFSVRTGKRNVRLKRSNNISYKTFDEAKKYGFSKYLEFGSNYNVITAFNDNNTNFYQNLLNDNIAKSHHVAEIIVENEDGYKYVYGLPVYNIKQKEQSFSIAWNQGNELASKNWGLTNFTNGSENSSENSRGDDHFFSSTETPAYVTTYLLTAILSKDYQDITNNGPSPDDYGDYVRFDFEKVGNYNWKTPTSSNGLPQASLNIGFITDHGDDKGHVIYGEREQYRPSFVSNKTELANYRYYENRKDGYGEIINGTKSSNSIGVLKSITKYSLHDYINNTINSEKIKSAFFEYDYSLCPGIYNGTNGGGKLTLKKVYILNGESDKGKFSPYEFSYYADNTSYSPKAVNRWGGYQPRNPFALVNDSLASNSILSNSDFPYVPQNNRSSQDHFSSIWNLNKIKLPSGGEIHVKYEADDYAYIQDKKAMQMVKIKGFSETKNGTITNLLKDRNYLHFDINDPLVNEKLNVASSIQQKEILKSYYLNDILEKDGQLYYKVLGRLKPDGVFHDLMANEAVWEYVPGWAQIDATDYGVLSNGGSYSGYLKLKETCIENRTVGCINNINSIQKTLMQALRLNLPGYLYGTQVNNTDSDDESVIIDAILGLTSIFQQVVQVVSGGVNNWMYIKNYGNMVDLDKSFIRLYCPSKKKISGSIRVSHIAMIDNFETMTGGVHKNGVYGKRYEYTTTANILNEEVEISSGVAAYEPSVGRDENPFFMPKFFDEKVLFAPDNSKYQEDPLMEDYFPGPQIVYSKMITKDLYLPYNITVGAVFDFNILEIYKNTGYIENQFYTYKDFPIQVDETDKVHAEPYKIKNIVPLNLFTREYYTAAQGYSFVQYMMHGKPKATYIYDSEGSRISGQESHYKTNSSGLLDYNVKAIVYENNDLIIKDVRMGLESKLFADSREHLSKIKTIGVQTNMEVTGVFPFIGIIPTVIPEYSDGETRFRSLVLVKTIRHQPILYKTVAINGTSEISTEHLLWDAETAQPIVSQTYNEFGDPVYQVNLPAHLAYKGMGLAYQNSGATFTNVNANEGIVSSGSVGNNTLISAATEGDKLIFHTSQNSGEYWVLRKTNNSLYLIDKNGSPARFANVNLKIDDSGYSNQAGAALASYIMKKNPIMGNRLVLDEAKEIIDANVTTYKNKWSIFCKNQDKGSNINDCNIPSFLETFSTTERNFQTEYFYKPLSAIQENIQSNHLTPGYFCITNNPSLCHPTWANCESLDGDFMIIDGNAYEMDNQGLYIRTGNGDYKYLTRPLKLWCKSLSVCKNTEYKISFSLINITPSPEIYFTVNGERVGPIFDPGNNTCQWHNYSFNWNSNNFNQIELCIYNKYISNANDFGIDNIGLNPIRSNSENNPTNENYCVSEGNITNPFLSNILGNWRPEKSYVFQTDRKSSNNIRVDGPYINKADNYNNTFINFWKEQNGLLVPNVGKWTWTTENTLVSPFGMELEARDPLNRYSAELSGYNHQKTVAVAANARYNEIAYYGAEVPLENGVDIYGLNGREKPACRPKYHINITDGIRKKYNEFLKPNSGEYYLEFDKLKTKILDFGTTPISDAICELDQSGPYNVQECDCIPAFKPTVGKKYLISAWIKDPSVGHETGTMPYIEVKIDGTTFNIKEYGPVIEGWRKVSGSFDLGYNAQSGSVTIKGNNGKVLLDDIRIHPYHATMKTYNYDLKTLRFTFEHDDNNFFTRYDYAKDGTLQRVSKQTERGIQTLQESSFGQQKSF